jgi:HD superfamily phosphohydrolase
MKNKEIFGQQKNTEISLSPDKDINSLLHPYCNYIYTECKKGRVPLIIAGAGVSASAVRYHKEGSANVETLQGGLPTLLGMVEKIYDLLSAANDIKDSELRKLINILSFGPNKVSFEEIAPKINREWLSKVFTVLSDSNSIETKKIWESFCEWFLFSCIDKKFGAFTTIDSEAAEKIVAFADKTGAVCFSANFDNYLTYRTGNSVNPETVLQGISIFSKDAADNYFKRTRRARVNIIRNKTECILHANGDVFWLSCNGKKIDGYCPRTGKFLPAFGNSAYGFKKAKKMDDLICDICGSRMDMTMTMPGTYKKDHDTREIISSIWKYVASKISTVITVGITCNWDDVLLKFIIGLLDENNIPHMDINNNSEKWNENASEIYEKTVKNPHFNSLRIIAEALKCMEILDGKLENIKQEDEKEKVVFPEFTEVKTKEIKDILEKEILIIRLKHVSQVGLKAYWLSSSKKNDRWTHSINVAECVLRFYDVIKTRYNDLQLEDRRSGEEVDRGQQERNKKNTIAYEKVLLYLSGLLHDCGHLPFSHLLEEVFNELSWKFGDETGPFNHNHYTAFLVRKLFQENEHLNAFLRKNEYPVDCEDVIKVINGKYGLGYIDALINSEVDCDKIEYLFTDSDQVHTNLMLDKDAFEIKLREHAYITQEGLLAYDSESAWYALRLLDERKRLYKELYFKSEIRSLEIAVKFIITTYFVQKFNSLNNKDYKPYSDIAYNDLSHCRIMMVIEDFFDIAMEDDSNENNSPPLCSSLSEQMIEALKSCMTRAMQPIVEERSGKKDEPNEIKILKEIYKRLVGEDFKASDSENAVLLTPYMDKDIAELTGKLSQDKLEEIRKKIHLNFPGAILIDVYNPVRYLSPSKKRQECTRLDGTKESQAVILIPDCDREQMRDKEALASIDIKDYVKKYNLNSDEKPVFNVYLLNQDKTSTNHVINMLKKEIKKYVEGRQTYEF